MKQWVGVICVILIIGVFSFFALDEELGTTETNYETATVIDTNKKSVRTANTTVVKFYITVQMESGETETFTVTHDDFDKIEPKNEVTVKKTTTETKWTHQTMIKYELN